MGDEVNEGEAGAGPYKPYGPAPKCDVLSTPRWHFALWGIWGLCGIGDGARGKLFVFIRTWFVLLFCVGFLYVGCVSLYEAVRPGFRHRDAEAQLPSTHSSPRPQSMLS